MEDFQLYMTAIILTRLQLCFMKYLFAALNPKQGDLIENVTHVIHTQVCYASNKENDLKSKRA